MGTLFSLSKSATSATLGVSELALLLFGLLLVVGLIGEYAESDRWKKHVKIFEMLVIIGVAGELFADGGIFLFSAHLQTIADTEIADLTRVSGDARTSSKEAAEAAKLAKASADASGIAAGIAQKTADAAENAGSRAKASADAADARARTANNKSATALSQAKDAAARAGKAEASLGKAEAEAKNAENSASNALTLARDARKEADSFESDLARLKQQAADRVLDEYQQGQVRLRIFRFLSVPYELACNGTQEASALLLEIDSAVSSAGWTYKESENKTFRFALTLRDGRKVEQWNGKAVEIGFSKALAVRLKPPAIELAKALREQGITAFAEALQDSDPSPNSIHISVGSKP